MIGGQSDELSVDIYKLTLERGDTLLVCNDGLYNMVDDKRLQDLLAKPATAATACQELVDLANANGGTDNITCVVSPFFEAAPEDGSAFAEAEVPAEDSVAAGNDANQTHSPARTAEPVSN